MAHLNPILDRANQQAAAPNNIESSDSKLKAVEAALDVSSARIAESITSAEASAQETSAATQIMTEAISDITSANRISASAKSNADLQAQNANINILKAAGGLDNQTRLVGILTEEGNRVASLLDEKSDIVDDEHTGIQIIDNIVNSFRSLQLDVEIEAARDEQAQTALQIANITGSQESFARVNSITKETLNNSVIESNYKAIEAEGRLKREQLNIENIRTNANAMNEINRIGQVDVQNKLQVFRLEGEAQEREIKKERQSFQREQMEFQRKKFVIELPAAKARLEALNLQIADTKDPKRIAALTAQREQTVKSISDNLAFEADLVKSVQAGQSAAGLTVETPETIVFNRKRPALEAKYVRLQETGASENQALGLTPFDAQSTISVIDPDGLATKSMGTRVLSDIARLQVDKWKKEGKIPKDPAVQKSDFNTTAGQVMTAIKGEIRQGDTSNPFHAPPFSVLSEKASIRETPLFQEILKAKNMQETNAQTIMDAAVAGVLSKTITPEEAADGVEAIFDAAALHNNTFEGGFERVGLPSQETYNVKLDRAPSLFEQLGVKITPSFIFDIAKASIIEEQLGTEGKLVKGILDRQIGAFVSVNLMDKADIQQAIVIILSAVKESDAPTNNPDADNSASSGQGE